MVSKLYSQHIGVTTDGFRFLNCLFCFVEPLQKIINIVDQLQNVIKV